MLLKLWKMNVLAETTLEIDLSGEYRPDPGLASLGSDVNMSPPLAVGFKFSEAAPENPGRVLMFERSNDGDLGPGEGGSQERRLKLRQYNIDENPKNKYHTK
jgi:hypothetical protein